MSLPVRVRYQTIEIGTTDIHLCTLRDKQQFSDPVGEAEGLGISSATWPIFGVVWPSSLVLANHMQKHLTKGKRILEIGCGMALSSLLLNHRKDDITATDYHPEVEHFLERNTQLNNDGRIAFERVDWASGQSQLGQFDLMIGSDLLYEDQHISLLADFIEAHAKPACEVIIVDPGRGRKNKFSRKMSGHGFTGHQIKPAQPECVDAQFKGHILTYVRAVD